MTAKNITSALAYFQAMNNRDLTGMEQHLHPEIQFIGPLAKIKGKEGVLKAVKPLLALCNNLKMRAQFSEGDQVMLAYDIDFQDPIGHTRTAVLLTFKEGLIIRYEVFFDARPFGKS